MRLHRCANEDDQTKTVKQYRDEYKGDPKLLDDSLPFEYVPPQPVAHLLLFYALSFHRLAAITAQS